MWFNNKYIREERSEGENLVGRFPNYVDDEINDDSQERIVLKR